MNIIFVCKRYYTNKDVIRDQYGRLYELPIQLANLGHHITVLCLDYKNINPVEDFVENFEKGTVSWITLSLQHFFTFKVFNIYRKIKHLSIDMVIGSSDIPCLWFSMILAKRLGTPNVVDLYDNYESFGQAKIPGFRNILKKCIQQSDLVIVVSATLRQKVFLDYKYFGVVHIMVNGINPNIFNKGDQYLARRKLGLPLEGRLIGTAGGLSEMKGMDTVYNAWDLLKSQNQNIYLVLAGKIDTNLPIPNDLNTIYLGEISGKDVGLLFQALDVGIISAHDSEFGKYCFPQKMYEMVASGLPIVAAKVGVLDELLSVYPEIQFKCDDVDSLAKALIFQMDNLLLNDLEALNWSELIVSLESSLQSLIR